MYQSEMKNAKVILLNTLNARVALIQKPVNWSAMQI